MATKKEIWAAARALWESTPNISYQEVVDHLQDAYGHQAPAAKSTVYNRARKEGWRKLTPMQKAKKQNEIEQRTKQPKKQNIKNNKVADTTGNDVYRTIIDGTEKTKQKVVLSTEERASVIIKHRKRLHNLGALEDAIIMLSLDAAEKTLNPESAEIEHVSTEQDDYAFYDNDDESPVARQLGVAKSLSTILGNLTQSQKVIAEQEMPMCGITPEDFSQSEQERRLGALEALAGIEEEERAARERLRSELQERLQVISGLEHDPNFFGNDSDDIEDAEFGDIEDDV